MPNHCQNELWITGKKTDVDALLAHIEGVNRVIDFDKVVPYPDSFRIRDDDFKKLSADELIAKYGPRGMDGFNSGGCDWCEDNWGTKWNAYAQSIRPGFRTCIDFQTAWRSPQPLIVALHKLFPKCTLRVEWFERGMERCGGWTCYSKQEFEDFEEDGEWAPGMVSREWDGVYRGHKGG